MAEPACLSEEQLLPLVGGEGPPADVQGHLRGCAECRHRLDQLKSEVSTLRSTFRRLSATLDLAGRAPAAGRPSLAAADVPALIGKYRVIGVLDSGGQASVYRVAHPNLARELVVKLAHPAPGRDAGGRQAGMSALLAEGKILAELDHPNLARVYDLDFHEDRPFLVMEYIRGRNLRQHVAGRRLPPHEAAALLAKIARALGAAHARGVVHLDVKPDNIVIDESGQPRIIDFGIARLCSAWSDGTPGPAMVSGTPGFASPEQVSGKATDARSDIFCLGATLYYLLAGRAPFDAPTTLESVTRSEQCQYDRDALRAAGAPRALRRVCEKAMQADPAMRYATAEDLASDLEAVARAPRRRRRVLAALAGAALGIAAAVAVWHFTRPTPAAKPEAVRFAESFLGRPLHHDFPVQVQLVGATPDASGQYSLVEGEKVALRIEVDRDCYLGVWHIDAQGKVTQLFPSRFESDHLVRAGQARTIPGSGYAIRATLSQGPEYLFVAASTSPWEFQAGQRAGPYAVFETPRERAEWEERVRGLITEPDQSPQVAEAIVSFRVKAKQP